MPSVDGEDLSRDMFRFFLNTHRRLLPSLVEQLQAVIPQLHDKHVMLANRSAVYIVDVVIVVVVVVVVVVVLAAVVAVAVQVVVAEAAVVCVVRSVWWWWLVVRSQ